MKIKAIALSVALGVTMIAGVTSTTPAYATGIPVIDAANLANAIQQYTQMVEQLAQLKAQLDQAKQQYESLTGGRGMGNLVRSTGAIPKNWQETLASMKNGELGDLSKEIRQSASLLDEDFFADVDQAFAWDEGEGDRSLAFWRRAHDGFFGRSCARIGIAWHPGLEVVCERFRVVWPPAAADG